MRYALIFAVFTLAACESGPNLGIGIGVGSGGVSVGTRVSGNVGGADVSVSK